MNNEKNHNEEVFNGSERSLYANEIKLMGGQNDAVLVFEFHSPRGIEETVNIIATPSVLKALGQSINGYIDYYEESFYKLPDVETKPEKYNGHNSTNGR